MMKCGKWIVDNSGVGKCCDEPSKNYYLHNGLVCSYCDEHNYACGEPITEKKASYLNSREAMFESLSKEQIIAFIKKNQEATNALEAYAFMNLDLDELGINYEYGMDTGIYFDQLLEEWEGNKEETEEEKIIKNESLICSIDE